MREWHRPSSSTSPRSRIPDLYVRSHNPQRRPWYTPPHNNRTCTQVSDVVSRGLDVSACDAVFNMELPSSASHYAHRAGRTGRMDAPGTVVSIVDVKDVFVVEKLHKVGILTQLLCVGCGVWQMRGGGG